MRPRWCTDSDYFTDRDIDTQECLTCELDECLWELRKGERQKRLEELDQED